MLISQEEDIVERFSVPLMDIDRIEFQELKKALEECKNRKSPGIDNLNMELFKYAPIEVHYRILDIFNQCWLQCKIPIEWKLALVIPIFKKGDRKDFNNYRGISILSAGYKLYAKIITNRLRNIVENILLEEQTGFRKGRSCSDNIFILKQLIEKRREFNCETHVFIDCMKAFDRVLRNKIFEIMDNRGIPKHLIVVLQDMYADTKICCLTQFKDFSQQNKVYGLLWFSPGEMQTNNK